MIQLNRKHKAGLFLTLIAVGIGLLLSGRLSKEQRKAAGIALALVGGLTTIPLALGVIGQKSAGTSEIRSVA